MCFDAEDKQQCVSSHTTFPSSSGKSAAERCCWWSHHLLAGVQRRTDCFYSGWIIGWDREEHFISAGQIINHCHYLCCLVPGVSATCPRPGASTAPLTKLILCLASVAASPASGSRMLLAVWAQHVFEKVIIIYCSPQGSLAEEWRSFVHEIECGDIKTRNHFCLHANTLIFPKCDSLTGWIELTSQELLTHSCCSFSISLFLFYVIWQNELQIVFWTKLSLSASDVIFTCVSNVYVRRYWWMQYKSWGL